MRPLLTLLVLASAAVITTIGCSPEADGGTAASPASESAGTGNVSVADPDDEHEHNIVGDTDEDKPGADDVEDSDGKDDDRKEEKKDDSKGATLTTSAPQQPSLKLTVYRNASGKLMCPVMDVPIESEERAFGFADWKGKRYYFCCDGCPMVFDKNKDTYAK